MDVMTDYGFNMFDNGRNACDSNGFNAFYDDSCCDQEESSDRGFAGFQESSCGHSTCDSIGF